MSVRFANYAKKKYVFIMQKNVTTIPGIAVCRDNHPVEQNRKFYQP
jgi:hypothetical protein